MFSYNISVTYLVRNQYKQALSLTDWPNAPNLQNKSDHVIKPTISFTLILHAITSWMVCV